jgi:competence protein ComEC
VPYFWWCLKHLKYYLLLIAIVISGLIILLAHIKTVPQRIDGNYSIVKVEKNTYNYSYLIQYHNIFLHFYSNTYYKSGTVLYLRAEVHPLTKNTIPNLVNYQRFNQGKNIYGELKLQELKVQRQNFYLPNLLQELINRHQSPMKELLNNFFFGGENDLFLSYLVLSSLSISLILQAIKKIGFLFGLRKNTNLIINILILLLFTQIKIHNYLIWRLLIYYILVYLNQQFQLDISRSSLVQLSFVITLLFMNELIFNDFWLALWVFNSLYFMFYQKSQNKYLNRLRSGLFSFFIFSLFNLNNFPQLNILQFLSYLVFSTFLATPLVGIIMISIFLPFLDSILGVFVTVFIQVNESINAGNWLIYLPKINNLVLVGLIIGFMAFFILPKKMKIIALGTISLVFMSIFLYHPLANGVYFLDVGQGDSSVVLKNNHAMVIDAYGGTFDFLIRNNITQIDYLILSHNDNDHIADAPLIIKYLHPSKIVISPYLDYHLNTPTISYLPAEKFDFQGVEIIMLGPLRNSNSANDNSIVFKFQYLDYQFLFTGDISSKVELDLIQSYSAYLDIEVLKVAHHGSNTSTSKEFVNISSPDFAVISLKLSNTWGFPHQGVINNLNSLHIKIYLTSVDGTIVFLAKKKIRTYRP